MKPVGTPASRTVKIAISLPAELMARAEQERETRGESRSAFFRRAVEEHLRRLEVRADVERYVRGYRERPETQAEVTDAHQLGSRVLSEESWE